MIRIGEVILQERTKRSLTQQQVAEFLNVTKATISKWEKGTSYPDITLLPVIASYFDITVDALLNAKQIMSKKEIRKWYKRFAERFSNEPFVLVHTDLNQFIKLYYDDENFLLQMSILLLNHAELAPESNEIFHQIIDMLERVESISTDVWIRRQANAIISTTALFNAEPKVALERLEDSVRPMLGEEMILSKAHEALGEVEEAKKVLQAMMYQQIIALLGGSSAYLKHALADEGAFLETIKRGEGMIALYKVDQLHPNISLQFYFAVAQYSAIKEKETLCEEYLSKYANLVSTGLLPFRLKADAYFNLLDDWFETLDLGAGAPREENVIIESIMQSLELPIFEQYKGKRWFMAIKEKLQFSIGGSYE